MTKVKQMSIHDIVVCTSCDTDIEPHTYYYRIEQQYAALWLREECIKQLYRDIREILGYQSLTDKERFYKSEPGNEKQQEYNRLDYIDLE